MLLGRRAIHKLNSVYDHHSLSHIHVFDTGVYLEALNFLKCLRNAVPNIGPGLNSATSRTDLVNDVAVFPFDLKCVI